jgi:bifunctional non-homologous end joining protein LigD
MPVALTGLVKTTEVPSRREAGKIDDCLMNDLPALFWATNLADLELQTFLHARPQSIGRRRSPSTSIRVRPPTLCSAAASACGCKRFWRSLACNPLLKHPVQKACNCLFRSTRRRLMRKPRVLRGPLAERLEREHAEQIVSRMRKALRKGKVLIDWSQNDEHKTTVNVYSLRAREQPTVSTPVTWQEVETTMESSDLNRLSFDSDAVLKRVENEGDLFASVMTLKQRLPSLDQLTSC